MIPIVINNRNRLTTTKKLVEDLRRLGYTDIFILDNDSTYPPLLEWYRCIYDKPYFYEDKQIGVIVIRLNENSGQLALWNKGIIEKFKKYPWIVYTDSDIQLNENAKPGFIEEIIRLGDAFSVDKVGLALDISFLSDNKLTEQIVNHESQFWEKRIFQNVYIADVDTTFAIIKPNLPFQYNALRVAGDYTAKHMPWYNDWDNLSDEEKYVLEHSINRFSTTKGRVEGLTKENKNV